MRSNSSSLAICFWPVWAQTDLILFIEPVFAHACEMTYLDAGVPNMKRLIFTTNVFK